MIRDRKGWIAPTAIMVMTAIVLLAVLLNAYQTTEEVRNNPLGRTQIYMLSKVQDAYRAQTYTDLAAKHALRKAIINAAKNGGYESGAYSECGTYGFFQLWSNRTDKCFPDEEKDVLGTEFEKEIDRYIAAYPEERELIKGVFKTTVNEEDGTEVVAKATLPWRFGELYYPKKLDAFPVQGATKDKFSNDWHMPREEGKRYHLGTDIFAEKGTPVLAAKGGKILRMGCNSYGGNRIGIVDEEGNYFYYAHLDSYQPGIGEGMTVKAGQQIGTVGDTLGCKPGCTGIDCGIEGKTEPHLHFGIYVRPTDQEDTIKQESAYNPYYALVATLDGKEVNEVTTKPSFEYKYYPALKVKENYHPSDYDKIKEALSKMEQECWAMPECYVEAVKNPENEAEFTKAPETEEQEESEQDNSREQETTTQSTTGETAGENLDLGIQPTVATSDATATATPQEFPEERPGVQHYGGETEPDAKGNTGFDWVIQYNGRVITQDENGTSEEEKWHKYCETPEEYYLGKIRETIYQCMNTKDDECMCGFDIEKEAEENQEEFQTLFKTAEGNELQEIPVQNPFEAEWKEYEITRINNYYSTEAEKTKTGKINLGRAWELNNIWLPFNAKMNWRAGKIEMTFLNELASPPTVGPIESSGFYIYKSSKAQGPKLKIMEKKEAMNGNTYESIDKTLKIKEEDVRECTKPKVIKVCVINTKTEIPQITTDENGKETVDYAPVVYRFAYHLKSGIPRKIKYDEIEVKDKFREKGAVVLKWPDVDTDENTRYDIYYSKGDMTTFKKKKLDEMAEKTAKGEQLQRHAPVYKIELEAKDAERHEGSININYIFYDALHGNKWYTVTLTEKDENGNEQTRYELVELRHNQLYHFSNPHYVYVVDKLEDGIPYYFTIVGVNEDNETTDEPLESIEGKSIDDAPPEPPKNIKCEYIEQENKVVCTLEGELPEGKEVKLIQVKKDENGEEKVIVKEFGKDKKIEFEGRGDVYVGSRKEEQDIYSTTINFGVSLVSEKPEDQPLLKGVTRTNTAPQDTLQYKNGEKSNLLESIIKSTINSIKSLLGGNNEESNSNENTNNGQ